MNILKVFYEQNGKVKEMVFDPHVIPPKDAGGISCERTIGLKEVKKG